MNKKCIILAVLAVALSTFAQETNNVGPRREKKPHPDRQEQVEKKRTEHQQRRLRLMERELKRIGVTEEEKAQIVELQKMHKEKMAANTKHTAMARERLSKLLDDGAPMEALEAAIQEVSAAQTEQLRILVRNRIEMERILGREKNAQFMQNARTQFQKHGRRSGPGLPPRPGLPPIPGQHPGGKQPPMPDHRPEHDVPPPPP